MLIKLYRKLIPLSFRRTIYNAFLGRLLTFKRNFLVNVKSKCIYCFNRLLPKTEENQAYAFMGRHGLTSYPYRYALEYKNINIKVEFDSNFNLPFVMHINKKLYFPSSYTREKIIRDYRNLLIEQDIRSAHRYVKAYNELKGKTLLDIGSADGNFALDAVEYVNHVYLFEYESIWFAPLKATFEPWKEKVTLVKKYISDKSNDTETSIDDFLSDKSKDNLFLKMDIEGAEQLAIRGATNTLKNGKNIHLAVCTYHRKNDPEIISNLLSTLGYSFEFTQGLLYWQKRLSKAIIRCHN
jgi:hypothetical protein